MKTVFLFLFSLSGCFPTAIATKNQDASTTCSTSANRIMLVGDSITLGDAPDGGYRQRLWELLWQRPEKYQFVGSQVYPYTVQQPHHEGHAGATSFDIVGGIGTWISNTPADIVLLQIGTNDCAQARTDTIDNVTSIADFLSARGIRLVLSAIPPLGTSPTAANCPPVLNDAYETLAKKRHITFSNPHLEVTDLIDSVHPSKQGYDLTAQSHNEAL